MSNVGQARVLNQEQITTLFSEIKNHRHKEKNTLIMQLSFKLGLRVQEISLLRIKEVADIGLQYTKGFKVKDVLVLPKGFTKGARATKKKSATEPQRTSVRFTLDEFDKIIRDIEKSTKAGEEVIPESYYPKLKKSGGKTRTLPIVDKQLIGSIQEYLLSRLIQNPKLKLTDALIVSQKGGAYSPNTLQDHMGMMLKKWASVERASSHSGRRGLATELIHNQRVPIKTAQQVLGHKDASTTLIYDDVPEGELKVVLKKAGKSL